MRDEPLPLAGWFRRTGRQLALLRDDEFRRGGYRLALLGLRGLIGVRPVMGLLVAVAVGVYLFHTEVATAAEAYRFLMVFAGLGAMVASATMFAGEQRQGTLELLWLARGSAASLIRFKAFVLLAGITALLVPAVLVVAWFLEGRFPSAVALAFLVTNALFIVATMTWAGTLVPHPWAGGLLGAFALTLLYLALGDRVTFFNPFTNPVVEHARLVAGGGAFRAEMDLNRVLVINRIVLLVASGVLFSMASRRLGRLFR
jgi:hypothetical protein